MAYLEADPRLKGLPVELYADGCVAVAALHAAFFNRGISKVHLYRSFKALLERPAEPDRYAAVVPGVLQFYDLPDLVRWIGPDKVFFD